MSRERPTDLDKRPATVALMMRWFAEYSVLADKAVNRLAEITDQPGRVTVGGDVQDDLIALATWFEQHPQIDADIYAALFTGGAS